MLGSAEELVWEQTGEGLEVRFPGEKPSDYAHALRISLLAN